jgi:hypothetical protein
MSNSCKIDQLDVGLTQSALHGPLIYTERMIFISINKTSRYTFFKISTSLEELDMSLDSPRFEPVKVGCSNTGGQLPSIRKSYVSYKG